ncbi:MAG: VPLPA-CTERM sorting domain-containing protein [Pseudomonadota bacterium]
MLKKSLLVAALLSATVLSATAQASTVDLSYVSPNTYVATSLKIDGSTSTYWMGSANLTTSDLGTVVGFCVDPLQPAVSSVNQYQSSALDASDFISGDGTTRFANAQKLYDNAYASLSGAEQTAGFRLALWEIFHDDLSTTSGDILAVSGSNAGMLAAANTYLSALSGWSTTGAYSLTFYGNNQLQDFLVASPSAVPVPAALPLMASGLLGFGVMRRRNKSK